jgi:hypothetical protein
MILDEGGGAIVMVVVGGTEVGRGKYLGGTIHRLLLLLFVWPPVGGGFLSLPPRLHGPKGPPLNSPKERTVGRSRRVTMLGYRAYYFQLRAYATYAFLRTC